VVDFMVARYATSCSPPAVKRARFSSGSVRLFFNCWNLRLILRIRAERDESPAFRSRPAARGQLSEGMNLFWAASALLGGAAASLHAPLLWARARAFRAAR